MGSNFGRQDSIGEQFVILAPLREKIVEMIFFRGIENEARKRARLYAPNGDYKIIRRDER